MIDCQLMSNDGSRTGITGHLSPGFMTVVDPFFGHSFTSAHVASPYYVGTMNPKTWLGTLFVLSMLTPTAYSCICFKVFKSNDQMVGCGLLWESASQSFVCEFPPAVWTSQLIFDCGPNYTCELDFSVADEVFYSSPSTGLIEFYLTIDNYGSGSTDVDCDPGQCDFMDNYNYCNG